MIKPKLGNRKVADVNHDDVDTLHKALHATPYQANRILALLSKRFSLASEKWKMRPDNPCRGITKFPENSRERYLKPDELHRLIHALNEHPNKQTANVHGCFC